MLGIFIFLAYLITAEAIDAQNVPTFAEVAAERNWRTNTGCKPAYNMDCIRRTTSMQRYDECVTLLDKSPVCNQSPIIKTTVFQESTTITSLVLTTELLNNFRTSSVAGTKIPSFEQIAAERNWRTNNGCKTLYDRICIMDKQSMQEYDACVITLDTNPVCNQSPTIKTTVIPERITSQLTIKAFIFKDAVSSSSMALNPFEAFTTNYKSPSMNDIPSSKIQGVPSSTLKTTMVAKDTSAFPISTSTSLLKHQRSSTASTKILSFDEVAAERNWKITPQCKTKYKKICVDHATSMQRYNDCVLSMDDLCGLPKTSTIIETPTRHFTQKKFTLENAVSNSSITFNELMSSRAQPLFEQETKTTSQILSSRVSENPSSKSEMLATYGRL